MTRHSTPRKVESIRHEDKRTNVLKAEINEEAREQLYRTKNRPFKPPETGTIAV